MGKGGGIPDAIWLERAKRREAAAKLRSNPYNFFDEEGIARILVAECRAEIAEIRDTSLRWWPSEAIGYRKIAYAYWLIYDAQKAETNLQKSKKHLIRAIQLEPDNWLQHSNLSILCEALGQLRQALASCREALRLAEDPEDREDLEQRCMRLGQENLSQQTSLDFSATGNAEVDLTSQDQSQVTRAHVEGAIRSGMRIEVARDSGLRDQALRTHGSACMICGFDPSQHYPAEFAQSAVEVHHLIPLSQSGQTSTSMDDVWVVCANCHSIIHAWIAAAGKPERLREAHLFRPS